MIPAHSVQAILQDQREWIPVGAMDNLVVLERILDLLQQLLSLD